MNRRDAALALMALATAPLTSLAQQPRKVWRIGFLSLYTQADVAPGLLAFKQALRDLGYVEGRDYAFEPRFADNQADRHPALAAEVVRSGPDLIIAAEGSPARSVQRETSTIPVVMISVGDPVSVGLVRSLARPGGNITGTSNSLTDIAPKHLDLLHDALPMAARVAVMMNPNFPTHRAALETMKSLAPRIDLQILPIAVSFAREIEGAFAAITTQKAQALIVMNDSISLGGARWIAQRAASSKLPSIGFHSGYADAGFLMSYGASSVALYQRTAIYVDKILKGAKPADLPVEQPTTFELVINLKTAKAIGITIPKEMLLRADRVIT